jgi:hypothetical protein
MRVVCHPVADVEHHGRLFPTWMVIWHVCWHGWMSHSMTWPRPRTWLCDSAADMAWGAYLACLVACGCGWRCLAWHWTRGASTSQTLLLWLRLGPTSAEVSLIHRMPISTVIWQHHWFRVLLSVCSVTQGHPVQSRGSHFCASRHDTRQSYEWLLQSFIWLSQSFRWFVHSCNSHYSGSAGFFCNHCIVIHQ